MTTKPVDKGNAYGSDPRHHRIKDAAFRCSAPDEAPCRTSPTCECEVWCCCDGSPEDAKDNHDDGEHCCMTTVRPGQSCWMSGWVDATGIEDSFIDTWANGSPQSALQPTWDEDGGQVWPDGPVICDWDDGVFWAYADLDVPLPLEDEVAKHPDWCPADGCYATASTDHTCPLPPF